MAVLDVSGLSNDLRPTGTWAAALLHSLARDEAFGRRQPRVTEPRQATWNRFRGRLGSSDLLALLFEDAAVLHRIPFEPAALGAAFRLDWLPDDITEQWLATLEKTDVKTAGPEYILEQAKLLGLPTRLARSDLHVVKPHQKVLELPGTGGQLAHHLTCTQTDLTLQDNFILACHTWEELALAGIVALERGAPNSDFIQKVSTSELRQAEHPLRQRSFDFVIGLHPDKGGMFTIEDQLAIWFPNAKVLLV